MRFIQTYFGLSKNIIFFILGAYFLPFSSIKAQYYDFNLFVEINETSEGLYHIHIDPIEDFGPWDGVCNLEFTLRFDFYDTAGGTLLYTYQIGDDIGTPGTLEPLMFVGNENNSYPGVDTWYPVNLLYDYVISLPPTTCVASPNTVDASTIGYVEIVSSMKENCADLTSFLSYTIDYTGITGTTTVTTYTEEEAEITFVNQVSNVSMPTVTDLALLEYNDNGGIFEVLLDCDQNWRLVYTVPYGGCPPYSDVWNGIGIGGTTYTATPHPYTVGYWGSVSPTPVFEAIETIPSVSYTVTVTDSSNPTQSETADLSSFPIEDFVITPDSPTPCTAQIEAIVNGNIDNLDDYFLLDDNAIELPESSAANPIYMTSNEIFDIFYASYQDENGNYCDVMFPFTIDLPQLTQIDHPNGFTAVVGSSWTTNQRVLGDLVVPTGVDFEINGATIELMDKDSRIIVERGARLRIINSTIKGSTACGDYWQGILVQGNPNQNHPNSATFDPLITASPNHGVLYLSNSVVQDAQIGIQTGSDISTDAGGIVVAENGSTFLNNGVGILFSPPFTPTNVSRIENCEFTINAPFLGTLDLLGQTGIRAITQTFANPFTGNLFQNNTPGSVVIADKGTGIFNLNSDLDILDGNTFRNLFEGIDYFGSPTLAVQLRVVSNTFTGTHQGINLSSGFFTEIHDNTFEEIHDGTSDLNAYGVFSSGATGLTISDNSFDSDGLVGSFNNLGIIVRNASPDGVGPSNDGYDNFVTGNKFTGNFGIANKYEGDNSTMHIDCNRYSNPIYWDWMIVQLENGDVLQNQGICNANTPEEARRNSFHPSPSGNPNHRHIYHTGLTLFQYNSQSGFAPTDNFGLVSVNTCSFDSNNHCGSGDDEGGKKQKGNKRSLLTTKFDLNIYPNPASQQAQISWVNSQFEIGKLSIYDIQGRLVEQHFLQKASNRMNIDVSDYPTGIYICKLNIDAQIVDVAKLIVTN